MPFSVRITTRDERFNWDNLPDSDRPAMQRARDEFNTMQFDPNGRLRIDGPITTFDKPWREITGFQIVG